MIVTAILIIKMVKIRFDKNKGEWLDIDKDDIETDLDITIDGYLYDILKYIKRDLRDDLDHAMLIGGDVGSGKSNTARIIARIVSDENFNPKTHMIRDVDDIESVFNKVNNFECIIFDEGSGIFSATDTMTKKTKYANYVLDVCRQKNLLLIIIAPYLHRLTAAVAVDRTKTMIRTYINNKTGRRGFFGFYGTKAKERLYRFAKKNYGSLKGAEPKFRGEICLDKTFSKEYRKVKDETLNLALKSLSGKKEKQLTPVQIKYNSNLEIVKNNMDKPVKQLAQILCVTTRTIIKLRNKAKENNNL